MKLSFLKRETPEQKFQKNLENYKNGLEDDPDDLRLHVKIAELYLEHGKSKEAIDEYLEAARAYEGKRLFQIAVAIYKHVITVDPDMVDVYTELAELHLKNGFVGDCVSILEKLATRYYESDMKYEATQVLQKIGEIDPENKFFEIKVAKFYENKNLSAEETLKQGPKDKWELVDDKQEKTSFSSSPAEGFFDLEAALADDESINISDEKRGSDPQLTETDAGMTPDSVFKEIKQTLESDSDQDSPQFHFNLGMAYQRCNQLPEALQEFQLALDGLENKVECCLRLADCSMALNKCDQALSVIGTVLTSKSLSNVERLDLLYQSGLLYKAQGENRKALKVFKKVYDTDKNFKAVGTQIKQLSP